MQAFRKTLIVSTICSMFCLNPVLTMTSYAQDVKASSSTEIDLTQLERNAQTALAQKQYPSAAKLFEQLAIAAPLVGGHAYNAACAHALGGNTDFAFTWLHRAIEAGFLDVEHSQQDSDLSSLRQDPRWNKTMDAMQKRAEFLGRLWNSTSWKTPYKENLSENEKIAGLSKFWSEVKYNFIFTNTLRELDWDAVYQSYLTKVRATKSTLEYYKLLMEMCALLKDGHTNVYAPKELYQSELTVAKFRTRLIEGRVFVTQVGDPQLIKQGLVLGAEILKVNQRDVHDYARRELAPYASASTPQDLETRIYSYEFLLGSSKQKPLLEIRDVQGKLHQIKVERVSFKERNKVLSGLPAFTWRMLPKNIAYVALNSFNDDTAAIEYIKAFPEISKAKAIIFDVRDNGGGNGSVGFTILSTLVNKNFATSAAATRDYKPSLRAWGNPETLHQFPQSLEQADLQRQFSGKVVVLTSARTYSAAEDFTLAFDLMQRGKIIGEATGGSTGQPLFFDLPGGGTARVCTKLDSYPDGKAFVGIGIQPHHLVRPTITDFHAGRDTVLAKAVDFLQE
nr:S41 family peptidase [uncultured Undibacterium sp.]